MGMFVSKDVKFSFKNLRTIYQHAEVRPRGLELRARFRTKDSNLNHLNMSVKVNENMHNKNNEVGNIKNESKS